MNIALLLFNPAGGKIECRREVTVAPVARIKLCGPEYIGDNGQRVDFAVVEMKATHALKVRVEEAEQAVDETPGNGKISDQISSE